MLLKKRGRMNIAVIFAGGTGTRMKSRTVPKQFLKLHGKEIIIYTIQIFENNLNIDKIVVVCVEGWIDYLKNRLKEYNIHKVCGIVSGGNSGQESIYIGLDYAKKFIKNDDDIVLIHDGVRPLINDEIINKNIESVIHNGSAITVNSSIETILQSKNGIKINEVYKRDQCYVARAPQSFYFKDIYELHMRARNENREDFIDSASMFKFYGKELYAVEGPRENIKITTPMDYYLFRAIIEAKENSQIWS